MRSCLRCQLTERGLPRWRAHCFMLHKPYGTFSAVYHVSRISTLGRESLTVILKYLRSSFYRRHTTGLVPWLTGVLGAARLLNLSPPHPATVCEQVSLSSASTGRHEQAVVQTSRRGYRC